MLDAIGMLMFDSHEDVLEPNSLVVDIVGSLVFDSQYDVFEP
jgi:hypothetical protein